MSKKSKKSIYDQLPKDEEIIATHKGAFHLGVSDFLWPIILMLLSGGCLYLGSVFVILSSVGLILCIFFIICMLVHIFGRVYLFCNHNRYEVSYTKKHVIISNSLTPWSKDQIFLIKRIDFIIADKDNAKFGDLTFVIDGRNYELDYFVNDHIKLRDSILEQRDIIRQQQAASAPKKQD